MLGGFHRLRLAYSEKILQQSYQSDSEVEKMVFLADESFVSDWRYADNFMGDLKIESAIGDFATEDKFSFKAILEVDVEPMAFRAWHNNEIRNRRLALELTNNNEIVRVLNPFMMTYTYIGSSTMENLNRYELVFQRARMIDNFLDVEDNIISNVDVVCPVFSDAYDEGFQHDGVLAAGAYIKLKINAPNLYRFGYSKYNDVLTVTNWQASSFFKDIPENPYYFFAENLYNPFAPIISKKADVFCGDLVFEIISMTERILDNNVDPDWEDISTEYQNVATFAILRMTEKIIPTDNALEGDWTDEVTIESDFAIVRLTEKII